MSAHVFWFTGLSGSGKSTLAEAARAALAAEGRRILVLDGDEVRNRMHNDLGFGEADIKENNRRIAQICIEESPQYDVLLVPIISPYLESRRDARRILGGRFHEVYCNADIAAVVARDVKGLYASADRGEITNMIGFSSGSPYQAPCAPDLELDTVNQDVDQCARELVAFVRSCLSYDANSHG